MNKICPLMSRKVFVDTGIGEEALGDREEFVECQKNKCALWISGYTTEKSQIQCCTFEFLALKNAEGLYRV